MDKKFIYILFYFAGLLVGCESVHEVRMDVGGPRLVMNMVLNPDSLLKVNLSRTISDPGNYYYTQDSLYFNRFFVEDGTITLWLNGEVCGELDKTEKRGDYIWPGLYLSAGDHLHLRAEAPGYEPIEAETIVPVPVPILAVNTLFKESAVSSTSEKGTYWDLKLDIRFQDGPGIRNYYMLKISNDLRYVYTGDQESYYYSIRYPRVSHEEELLFEHDQFFGFNNMYISYYSPGSTYSYLFSDELIDGKETVLTFQIRECESSYYSDTLTLNNQWGVELYSLSHSYYLYYRSKAIQYEQEDFFWDLGLREPMPTYTNVKGGYGLISAYQQDNFLFTTPETDQPPINFTDEYTD